MGTESLVQPVGHIILRSALEVLASQEKSRPERIRYRLARGDGRLHARLRVAIARQLRLVLRRDTPVLRDLHLFGSSLTDQARATSDLDLLVHLRCRDPVAERQLERLAQQISSAYQEMVPDLPAGFCLISLQFVTDEQVRSREGFAALIGSAHTPSLRIVE